MHGVQGPSVCMVFFFKLEQRATIARTLLQQPLNGLLGHFLLSCFMLYSSICDHLYRIKPQSLWRRSGRLFSST